MKTSKQNKKAPTAQHSKPLLIVGIAALVLLVTVAALLVTNLVIKKPGEIADVDGGTIVSEKYGTFEIPNENMFIHPDYGYYMPNGTDLTYFYDDIMTKLAEYRKLDEKTFKAENKLLIQTNIDGRLNSAPEGMSKEEAFNGLIKSEIYPFKNCKSYYTSNNGGYAALDFINNKIMFDEKKLGAWEGGNDLKYLYPDIICAPIAKMSNWSLGSVDSLGYKEKDYCFEYMRCLSKKIEITFDGETETVYIPVVIISDKGYPLTESIYNEITADKAK